MIGDDSLHSGYLEDDEAPPTVPRPVPSVPARKPRGFAAMDPVIRKAISSKGGKAAHAAGTAHQFTTDEAREAGRKGGLAPHSRRGPAPRTAA